MVTPRRTAASARLCSTRVARVRSLAAWMRSASLRRLAAYAYTWGLAATASLAGCTVDGVVLVLRDAASQVDAAADTDVGRDATADAEVDAAQPDGAAPDAGDAGADGDAEVLDVRGACRIGGSSDGFYEDFPSGSLHARWLIADGEHAFTGVTPRLFRRSNVAIEDDQLVLRVRGDLHAAGRSSAAIVTRDMFASATYQVQGRFVAPAGVEVALWWQRDALADGTLDVATPGLDGSATSYARVRMRSSDGSASNVNQFALPSSLDDSADHILRFDRYTTATPAVNFWVDDTPRWNNTQNLPSARAGRMWIVAWLPDAAPANFDTAAIQITNAFVTPFGNDGDRCSDGELIGSGLVLP